MRAISPAKTVDTLHAVLVNAPAPQYTAKPALNTAHKTRNYSGRTSKIKPAQRGAASRTFAVAPNIFTPNSVPAIARSPKLHQ